MSRSHPQSPSPEEGRRLREAWAELSRAPAATNEADARVDSEDRVAQIWQALSGELSVEQRRALVDELARQPQDAEAWRIAREMFTSEAVQAELASRHDDTAQSTDRARTARSEPASWLSLLWPFGSSGERSSGSFSGLPGWQTALAAAAVLLVVIGIVSTAVLSGPEHDGTVRDATLGAQRTIEAITADGSTLPRDVFRLQWSEPEGAVRYTITVTTATLDRIHVGRDLESPETFIPSSAFEGMQSGTRLLWNVEATLRDGSLVSSPTFVVSVD